MYTWDQLQKANKICSSIDVKGKEYVEVNQRIKAFRSICPGGSITTEMLSNDNGVCVFRATVCDENMQILGTGTAYEKETSSFINKTSYIENCETSAVGRALGFLGIGIDTSIASAEEVETAIVNQGGLPKAMESTLRKVLENHGHAEADVCKHFKVKELKDLSVPQFKKLMDSMGENG